MLKFPSDSSLTVRDRPINKLRMTTLRLAMLPLMSPQRVKRDMQRIARKVSFIYKYTLYQYSRRMQNITRTAGVLYIGLYSVI